MSVVAVRTCVAGGEGSWGCSNLPLTMSCVVVFRRLRRRRPRARALVVREEGEGAVWLGSRCGSPRRGGMEVRSSVERWPSRCVPTWLLKSPAVMWISVGEERWLSARDSNRSKVLVVCWWRWGGAAEVWVLPGLQYTPVIWRGWRREGEVIVHRVAWCCVWIKGEGVTEKVERMRRATPPLYCSEVPDCFWPMVMCRSQSG